MLGFALRKAGGRTVRPRGSNATCARGVMPKTKGDPPCQLVALTPEQMWNLQGLHHQKYEGKEVVSCPGCLKAQEAVINGSPSDCERLRLPSGEHNKTPTTCLQAFWRVCVGNKTMYKNGNLGKKAELTVEEIEMAEKALSRATTAPGTPGTPSYDPGDGEDDDEQVPDTQEGGSSSAAPRKPAPTIDREATPKASVVDEDGDDMLLDEEPREKRGRGRPPGSKNRVGKKQKARLKELLKGANRKLVADNDVKSIALIPESQIRLGR